MSFIVSPRFNSICKCGGATTSMAKFLTTVVENECGWVSIIIAIVALMHRAHIYISVSVSPCVPFVAISHSVVQQQRSDRIRIPEATFCYRKLVWSIGCTHTRIEQGGRQSGDIRYSANGRFLSCKEFFCNIYLLSALSLSLSLSHIHTHTQSLPPSFHLISSSLSINLSHLFICTCVERHKFNLHTKLSRPHNGRRF